MYIYLLLTSILLVLYLLGKMLHKTEIDIKYEKNKDKLSFLYPVVLYWVQKSKYLQWESTKKRIETTRMLYPLENAKEKHLHEVCHELSILYCVLLIISLACIGIQASSRISEIKDVKLIRPQAGELDRNEDLTIILREKNLEVRENASFHIAAREYRVDEIIAFKEEAEKQIYELVKGENTDLESVTKDLQLISRIPGNPYKISWDVSGQELIDEDGRLHNKNINEKSIVTIQAKLSYQGEEEYLNIIVGVEPYVWSWNEKALRQFYNQVEEIEEESSTEAYYKLPDHVGEMNVSYERKEVDNSKKIFIVGLLFCAFLYTYWQQDIKNRKKEYLNQCQRSYPSMVSKLTLLVGAGMTVKGAWHRMVMDYCKEKNEHEGVYLYVYEEMLITWNEMMNGITEYEAFSRFGKRLQLRCYMRLSSLITQNLRKGTRGFLSQLEMEVKEAQEERKQVARQLGEEAGTKMLFPMIIMLVIVLIIVMVPAFLSFSKGGL